MNERVKRFKKILKEKGLDGFIVTSPVNIYYLTGFRGVSATEREAILVVNPSKVILITGRLYKHEASRLKSKSLDVKIADERNQINQFIKSTITSLRGLTPKVGFEEHDLKYSEFKHFTKLLKGIKLIPVKHLIEDLRIIKSDEEIKNIERAQVISQKAFDQVIKTIKVGQTEAEIAEKLEKIIKNFGGQGLAFESIVASGPNSALPHYVTGKRRIKKGDVLLFDFGAKYKNYCADLSRTIFLGRARDEQRNIYDHVQTSQNMAIAKICDGLAAKEAFGYIDRHFKKHKIHQYFLHSLGHGIGLEVHEKPSLSKQSKAKLAEGMIFSIEPGLYFPSWGGVRIEDLVLIKNGRAKLIGKPARFIQI